MWQYGASTSRCGLAARKGGSRVAHRLVVRVGISGMAAWRNWDNAQSEKGLFAVDEMRPDGLLPPEIQEETHNAEE
jgi:hypothetical protein